MGPHETELIRLRDAANWDSPQAQAVPRAYADVITTLRSVAAALSGEGEGATIMAAVERTAQTATSTARAVQPIPTVEQGVQVANDALETARRATLPDGQLSGGWSTVLGAADVGATISIPGYGILSKVTGFDPVAQVNAALAEAREEEAAKHVRALEAEFAAAQRTIIEPDQLPPPGYVAPDAPDPGDFGLGDAAPNQVPPPGGPDWDKFATHDDMFKFAVRDSGGGSDSGDSGGSSNSPGNGGAGVAGAAGMAGVGGVAGAGAISGSGTAGGQGLSAGTGGDGYYRPDGTYVPAHGPSSGNTAADSSMAGSRQAGLGLLGAGTAGLGIGAVGKLGASLAGGAGGLGGNMGPAGTGVAGGLGLAGGVGSGGPMASHPVRLSVTNPNGASLTPQNIGQNPGGAASQGAGRGLLGARIRGAEPAMGAGGGTASSTGSGSGSRGGGFTGGGAGAGSGKKDRRPAGVGLGLGYQVPTIEETPLTLRPKGMMAGSRDTLAAARPPRPETEA